MWNRVECGCIDRDPSTWPMCHVCDPVTLTVAVWQPQSTYLVEKNVSKPTYWPHSYHVGGANDLLKPSVITACPVNPQLCVCVCVRVLQVLHGDHPSSAGGRC